MLAIVLPINIVWLFLITVISLFTGFIFRSNQIRKKQKHIFFLESEMLRSHEEILKLQQELAKLHKEKEIDPLHKIRVIPIKDPKTENDTKASEASPKKKTNS